VLSCTLPVNAEFRSSFQGLATAARVNRGSSLAPLGALESQASRYQPARPISICLAHSTSLA